MSVLMTVHKCSKYTLQHITLTNCLLAERRTSGNTTALSIINDFTDSLAAVPIFSGDRFLLFQFYSHISF